ncbi:MAG: ABC transporter permease, partial [Bacteroidetes bacterium]
MLKNILIYSWRILQRNPGYTLVNVAGLTLGFLVSISVFLFVYHELGYDRYHEHYDRIYRVESRIILPESSNLYAISALPTAPALKMDFPGIKKFTRIQFPMDLFVTHNREQIRER